VLLLIILSRNSYYILLERTNSKVIFQIKFTTIWELLLYGTFYTKLFEKKLSYSNKIEKNAYTTILCIIIDVNSTDPENKL